MAQTKERLMSLVKIDRKSTTRRGFVKDIAVGAGGVALASSLKMALEPVSSQLIASPRSIAAPAPQGELKYRKYFTTELTKEEREIGFGASPMFLVFADNDIIEGCHFFSAMLMGESATKIAGHGPHKHRDPEVLVALGTDPDHPHELYAEYEIYMGPEMEKHVVNKPSLVFIPGNFVHCPFTVTKATRPFIFIEAQYTPKEVEVPLRDLVKPEMRDKYIFLDSDGSSEKGKPRTPAKKRP
jgi:hypothetical protein